MQKQQYVRGVVVLDVESDFGASPQGSLRCPIVQVVEDGLHLMIILRRRPVPLGEGVRALPFGHRVKLLTIAIAGKLYWTSEVHP